MLLGGYEQGKEQVGEIEVVHTHASGTACIESNNGIAMLNCESK